MFKRIEEERGDGRPMDEVIIRMLLTLLFDAVKDIKKLEIGETIGVSQFTVLLRALSRHQTVRIALEMWQDKVAEKAKETADYVTRRGKQRGLPSDVVLDIRNRILGIPSAAMPVLNKGDVDLSDEETG